MSRLQEFGGSIEDICGGSRTKLSHKLTAPTAKTTENIMLQYLLPSQAVQPVIHFHTIQRGGYGNVHEKGALPRAPKNAPAWSTETTLELTAFTWFGVMWKASLKGVWVTIPPAIPAGRASGDIACCNGRRRKTHYHNQRGIFPSRQ